MGVRKTATAVDKIRPRRSRTRRASRAPGQAAARRGPELSDARAGVHQSAQPVQPLQPLNKCQSDRARSNPLIVDSLRSGAVTRAEPVIMTVDGADRGSATVAPTFLTFSHATRDTVKTVGLSVPTVTLSQAAWVPYRARLLRRSRLLCSAPAREPEPRQGGPTLLDQRLSGRRHQPPRGTACQRSRHRAVVDEDEQLLIPEKYRAHCRRLPMPPRSTKLGVGRLPIDTCPHLHPPSAVKGGIMLYAYVLSI